VLGNDPSSDKSRGRFDGCAAKRTHGSASQPTHLEHCAVDIGRPDQNTPGLQIADHIKIILRGSISRYGHGLDSICT